MLAIRLYLLACLLGGLSLFAQETSAPELRHRLARIACICGQRAQTLPPQSAEHHKLISISTICMQALPVLAQCPNTADAEVLTVLARQLQPFTSHTIRAPINSTVPVTMPINEIVRLIEDEEVEVHLRPTPFQISAKRIMFRTLSELFYAFGSTKLALEAKDNPTPQFARDGNPLICLGRNIKRELWHDRSEHGLRAMRIFSNHFIDHIIPNKEPKKWQEFAELLIPIIISNCLAFAISKSTDESWRDLGKTLLRDIFRRLLMVQLFLKKKNVWYFMVMAAIYALAFYNSAAAETIWNSSEMDNAPSGWAQRRWHYLKQMGSSKENIVSVTVDALSSMAMYKGIDVMVSKIPVPQWLLATPVQQDPIERAARFNERTQQLAESDDATN